jgi:hypothetical protein
LLDKSTPKKNESEKKHKSSTPSTFCAMDLQMSMSPLFSRILIATMSGFCNNQDSGVGQQKKVNQTSAPLTSFKLPQLRGIICDLGDMHF